MSKFKIVHFFIRSLWSKLLDFNLVPAMLPRSLSRKRKKMMVQLDHRRNDITTRTFQVQILGLNYLCPMTFKVSKQELQDRMFVSIFLKNPSIFSGKNWYINTWKAGRGRTIFLRTFNFVRQICSSLSYRNV